MIKAHRLTPFALIAGLAASCSMTQTDRNSVSLSRAVCEASVDLGKVNVIVRTEWRHNQKDPEVREALAKEAIENAIENLPCVHSFEFGHGKTHDADTVVQFTLREFGPVLILSVPVIWTSQTHVDASVTVTEARNGRAIFVASEQRREGGAFAIRPLSAVKGTFESMISDWFVGERAGQPTHLINRNNSISSEIPPTKAGSD